jgi:LPS export ABC transporter protein LptC
VNVFSKLWFWFVLLILFLTIIMYDFDWEKEWKTTYSRAKMLLNNVHFSEIDHTFEHVRVFADVVDMDDSHSNMIASNVRALFFDKDVATRSGELLASSATKTPQEIKFWGDVRVFTTDNERMRSDELRYYVDRKDVYVPASVTLWKDDMIITGNEMRMNTQSKEGVISRNVVIRIWPSASGTKDPVASSVEKIASAPFDERIIRDRDINELEIMDSQSPVSSDTIEPTTATQKTVGKS